MTRHLSALLLCAAVLSDGGLMARAQPVSPQANGRAPAATGGTPATPPATTLRMRGTIAAYDAARGTLSLSTTTGPVQFPLASTVRIRRAGHSVAATELKTLSGYHAAVRYSESGGHKTVESVNVFEK